MNGPVWDNKGLCHIGIRNFATSTMLYKQCVIRFMEENRNPSIKTKKSFFFFSHIAEVSREGAGLYLASWVLHGEAFCLFWIDMQFECVIKL